jgi:hypothetical protein
MQIIHGGKAVDANNPLPVAVIRGSEALTRSEGTAFDDLIAKTDRLNAAIGTSDDEAGALTVIGLLKQLVANTAIVETKVEPAVTK